MTEIPKLIEEIAFYKRKGVEDIEKIKYNSKINKETIKEIQTSTKAAHHKTKEEIYQEMKNRYKSAWKEPAELNQEFSHVPVLKAEVLNEWQLERVFMPDRNFIHPLGYRGMKTTYVSNEFKEPPRKIYPKEFLVYLDKTKQSFNDNWLRPSKHGLTHLDERLNEISMNNKEKFKMPNLVRSCEFGFDKHSSWTADLKTKFPKLL